MGVVEEFIAKEKSSVNRIHRFLGIEPSFLFLYEVDPANAKANIRNPFIVRPSIMRRVIATFLLIAGTIGLISLISIMAQTKLLPIVFVFMIINLAWLALVSWTFFLNPKTSYTIIMDERQITLGNEVFRWNEISTCLIETKGAGRHSRNYLVIFTHQKTIHTFDLSNLGKSGTTILRNIKLRMDQFDSQKVHP